VLWLSDGTVIDESRDIMMWALQRRDPHGWWPASPESLAEALALIDRNDREFKHHLDRYKYATRYEGAVAIDHRAAAEPFLQTLDERLGTQPFLSGDRRGFLDAAIMPFVRQFANTDRAWFDAAPFRHVQGWLGRELAAPSFTEVMVKYPQWPGEGPGVRFPAASA
jgi:glutathione S-transferase